MVDPLPPPLAEIYAKYVFIGPLWSFSLIFFVVNHYDTFYLGKKGSSYTITIYIFLKNEG